MQPYPVDACVVDLGPPAPVPDVWCEVCRVPSVVAVVYGVVWGDAVLGRPLGVLRVRLCVDCRTIVRE